MEEQSIRVCLVDDHTIVRDGLKVMLKNQAGIQVTREFSDGSDFLTWYASRGDEMVDVLILDLTMPEVGGIEVLRRLGQSGGAPPSIILSVHDEHTHALDAIKAGAKGFLQKDCTLETLVHAVKIIHHGGLFISDYLLSAVMREDGSPDSADRISGLSGRESEIYRLICQGCANKEIAYNLSISERSVSTYKNRLMKKMHAETLADLIRIGLSRYMS
jgi:DNA-binding NarL/FixJ family response regulator